MAAASSSTSGAPPLGKYLASTGMLDLYLMLLSLDLMLRQEDARQGYSKPLRIHF